MRRKRTVRDSSACCSQSGSRWELYVVHEPNRRHDRQPFPVELDHEQPGNTSVLHGFFVILLGLLQLGPQIQQTQRWEDPETKSKTPGKTQVTIRADPDAYQRDKSSNDETEVDLEVGKQDEPSVSMAMLQLACRLGRCNRPCWVFSTDAYTQEEPINSQSDEQTRNAAVVAICSSAKDGRDDKDPC